MEQRDLLKDQIDQLSRALAHILSDFLGWKSTGKVAQGIEISNERLQGELDLDVEKVITLNKTELAAYIANKGLTEGHLETLSEYLRQVGMVKIEIDRSEGRIWLEKAIELLDIADEISKTASFGRINRKNAIKDILLEGS